MNVIILGAGRRGVRIARHLIQEKNSVTIIDSSRDKCTTLTQRLDCMALCGSATDLEMLESAGLKNTDVVIAVTNSDEVNLVACGIVESQYPKIKTIAAIRNIGYFKNDEDKTILGIDSIVNPETEAAKRICDIIQSGIFTDVISFDDADFILFNTTINKDGWLEGKSLIQMKKELPLEYIVVGIRRGNKTFLPSGDTTLSLGDELAIMAVDDEKDTIYKKLKDDKNNNLKLRRIVVVGATRVTRAVLKHLGENRRRRITLIEKDISSCNAFAEEFPSLLILNGSITDEDVWDDENLSSSDLFISLTENDELNIITASYAKRIGAKKTIALLKTNPNYLKFAHSLDIDVPLSLTDTTVDAIMKHLRGESVKNLHSIFDGDVEVYEYVLSDKFSALNKRLMDISLEGKCIIAGVKRGSGESFVPNGSYIFREGDTVLVASKRDDYSYITEFFK